MSACRSTRTGRRLLALAAGPSLAHERPTIEQASGPRRPGAVSGPASSGPASFRTASSGSASSGPASSGRRFRSRRHPGVDRQRRLRLGPPCALALGAAAAADPVNEAVWRLIDTNQRVLPCRTSPACMPVRDWSLARPDSRSSAATNRSQGPVISVGPRRPPVRIKAGAASREQRAQPLPGPAERATRRGRLIARRLMRRDHARRPQQQTDGARVGG